MLSANFAEVHWMTQNSLYNIKWRCNGVVSPTIVVGEIVPKCIKNHLIQLECLNVNL